MKRKWIIILCLVLALTLSCPPMLAFALVRTDSAEVPLLQEGEYELLTDSSAQYAVSYQDTTMEAYLYDQLLDAAYPINLHKYRVPLDEFARIYCNLINDHPDLFYVSSTVFWNYYSGENYVYEVQPRYSLSKSEIAAAQEIFDAGVQKALAQVDASMNDLQKALTVHDYLCSVAYYSEDVMNIPKDAVNDPRDKDIYHSAYAIFYDGIAVCAGYTLTYSYIMNMLGVECEYVISDACLHAWNKVKIDGNWYNVDLTNDDYDNTFYYSDKTIGNTPVVGRVKHTYFLKSDASFISDDSGMHYGGDTAEDCAADNTLYDGDNFWDDVYTRIYTVNGDFYYLDPDFDTKRSALTKRTTSGSESVVKTFSSVQLYYLDDDGNIILDTRDNVIRLAYLDGRFYVAYRQTVDAVFTDKTSYTVASLSYYPAGIDVLDGNLVYNLYSDTNLYTLDKKEYFKTYTTAGSMAEYNNYPDVNNDGFVNGRDWVYIVNE